MLDISSTEEAEFGDEWDEVTEIVKKPLLAIPVRWMTFHLSPLRFWMLLIDMLLQHWIEVWAVASHLADCGGDLNRGIPFSRRGSLYLERAHTLLPPWKNLQQGTEEENLSVSQTWIQEKTMQFSLWSQDTGPASHPLRIFKGVWEFVHTTLHVFCRPREGNQSHLSGVHVVSASGVCGIWPFWPVISQTHSLWVLDSTRKFFDVTKWPPACVGALCSWVREWELAPRCGSQAEKSVVPTPG